MGITANEGVPTLYPAQSGAECECCKGLLANTVGQAMDTCCGLQRLRGQARSYNEFALAGI
jgi:hypothetical protein